MAVPLRVGAGGVTGTVGETDAPLASASVPVPEVGMLIETDVRIVPLVRVCRLAVTGFRTLGIFGYWTLAVLGFCKLEVIGFCKLVVARLWKLGVT